MAASRKPSNATRSNGARSTGKRSAPAKKAAKATTPALVPAALSPHALERRIYLIRSQKVMFDFDLAELYQVPTKRLNEQVRRNRSRFPADFMFRLTAAEWKNLKSQFATSSWGGRRKLPYAFTEHGVAMLSSILKSDTAVAMNIKIIRAFVKLREFLAAHRELAERLSTVEGVQRQQASVIGLLAREIDNLKRLPEPTPKRRIGFQTSS